MKKGLVTLVVALFFGVYVFFQRSSAQGRKKQTALANLNAQQSITPNSPTTETNPSPINSGTQPQSQAAKPTPTPAPAPSPAPPPTPPPSGKFRDGVYTGQAADAYYGYVQVRATVTAGKLAKIEFLQYPNDRQHSLELNSYALPILRSEAITNQTAKVDTVSGATDSSIAFRQSLQSALTQAS